jgi:hypothetical protein
MTIPTSNDPDEIRAEIERTRASLGNDVDAIAEKVSPSSIAHRQVASAKGRLQGAREAVMGKASDARDAVVSHTPGGGDGPGIAERAGGLRDSAAGGVQGASDALHSAPSAARHRAEGNPLAAGLIAFGVGWLASSLIPATERETQLASAAKDKLTSPEVKGALQDKAGELKEALQGPAQDALESVKLTAQDAVDNVKAEAQGASVDVRDSAQEAKENVTATAQEQKATVTS